MVLVRLDVLVGGANTAQGDVGSGLGLETKRGFFLSPNRLAGVL